MLKGVSRFADDISGILQWQDTISDLTKTILQEARRDSTEHILEVFPWKTVVTILCGRETPGVLNEKKDIPSKDDIYISEDEPGLRELDITSEMRCCS